MLKRVLEQMQFEVEGTGGGCEAMTLYVDGHAIVVSIDAHTDFDQVTHDQPISVSVYQTLTRYTWSDENFVTASEIPTQSDALNVVIEALDFVRERNRQHGVKLENALSEVWNLMLQRHGWGELCAYEVPIEEVDQPYQEELKAWLTMWDSVTDLAGWEQKVKGAKNHG